MERHLDPEGFEQREPENVVETSQLSVQNSQPENSISLTSSPLNQYINTLLNTEPVEPDAILPEYKPLEAEMPVIHIPPPRSNSIHHSETNPILIDNSIEAREQYEAIQRSVNTTTSSDPRTESEVEAFQQRVFPRPTATVSRTGSFNSSASGTQNSFPLDNRGADAYGRPLERRLTNSNSSRAIANSSFDEYRDDPPPHTPQRTSSLHLRSSPASQFIPDPSIPHPVESNLPAPILNVPDSLSVLAVPTEKLPLLRTDHVRISVVPLDDSNTLLHGFPGLEKARLRGNIRLEHDTRTLLPQRTERKIVAIKISFKVPSNLFVHFGGVEEEGLPVARKYQFQKYTFAVMPSARYKKEIPTQLVDATRDDIFLDISGSPQDFYFDFRIPQDAKLLSPCHAVDSRSENTLSIRYELKVKVSLTDYTGVGSGIHEIRRNFLLPNFPIFSRQIIKNQLSPKSISWSTVDGSTPTNRGVVDSINSFNLVDLPPNVYNSTGTAAFDYSISLEPQTFGPGDSIAFSFRCVPVEQYWKVKFIRLLLIEEWKAYSSKKRRDGGPSASVASALSFNSVHTRDSHHTTADGQKTEHKGHREVLNYTFKEEVNGQFWRTTTKVVRVPRDINRDILEGEDEVIEVMSHKVIIQIGIADRRHRRLSLYNLTAKKERPTVSEYDVGTSSIVSRKSTGSNTGPTKTSKSNLLVLEAPVVISCSKQILEEMMKTAPNIILPPNYENENEVISAGNEDSVQDENENRTEQIAPILKDVSSSTSSGDQFSKLFRSSTQSRVSGFLSSIFRSGWREHQ
ncbi:hypothetical protein HK096_005780 [Nowakowskiella sp. JEL0078]|nr:hypothetical protein HK096_005780 [Nowakowskiella sp. JEL0078]